MMQRFRCKEVLANRMLQRSACKEAFATLSLQHGFEEEGRDRPRDGCSQGAGASAARRQKHGFVREDTTRGSGRERWWERVPRPISLNATEFGSAGADREASDLVMAEWQRNRQKRLAAFLAHGLETVGKEWIEVSGVSTANVQLTVEQMHDLTEELAAVVDSHLAKYRNQKKPGARPVQIHVDVFPIIDGVEQGSNVGGSAKDEQ
jgi:hypothetical protein